MFIMKYELQCEFCGNTLTFKNMEDAYKTNDWIHVRRDIGEDAGVMDICPECWEKMKDAVNKKG